jgi:sporulation protein YlmC with PRC-barrel domain
MKRRGLFIVVIIIFTLFAVTSLAQEKSNSKKEGGAAKLKTYKPPEGGRINAFMVEKIIGSKVFNMKGQELGTIKDIVIDIDTARVLYAVMDFGSVLGIGGKLFPVPWDSLAPFPAGGVFFMQASKARLKKAPGYNKDSLPDMGDTHWRSNIAQFYRTSQQEGLAHGYGYGVETYPAIARQDVYAEVFDPKSIRTIRGQVLKVGRVRATSGKKSQMEIELVVYVDRKQVIPVYLGPVWFVGSSNRGIPFKPGDTVSVTGSWITSQQAEPFLIASSVTRGDEELTLRDKEGTAVWSGWKKLGR